MIATGGSSASWGEVYRAQTERIAQLERELAEARALLRDCRERIRSMPFENSEGERETYRILARIDTATSADQPDAFICRRVATLQANPDCPTHGDGRASSKSG